MHDVKRAVGVRQVVQVARRELDVAHASLARQVARLADDVVRHVQANDMPLFALDQVCKVAGDCARSTANVEHLEPGAQVRQQERGAVVRRAPGV